MSTLYTGIAELVTNDPAQGDGSALGIVEDGAVIVEGDSIAWVGHRRDAPAADACVDWGGATVFPGFVDSHAHLVFAGERSAEFAARMSGQPYAAGGIATTVAATRAADDATLTAGVGHLANELLRAGVTTFETKSGYGLTIDDEARSLTIAHHSPVRQRFSVPMSCLPNSATTEMATSIWFLARCSTLAPRWRDGSMCSATAEHSMSMSRVPSWPRELLRDCSRVCTPDNSGPAKAFGWRWSWGLRRSTTALTRRTRTSRRWRAARRWPRCYRVRSSRRGQLGRMRVG